MRTLCLAIALLVSGAHPLAPPPEPGDGLARAALDSAWIESNLRFALRRAREGVRPRGKVGVFLGRGVSAPSGQAIVRRLEEARLVPRLLFEGDSLDGLACVIVPGGWAPSQRAALGERGLAALGKFVAEGGRYVGVCAGAYLVCATVQWEGARSPSPLPLARGRAFGPVAGLAPWPTSGPVEVTEADGRSVGALYAGGCAFDVAGAEVRARYPDASPALIEVPHGRGRLALSGVHLEFTRADADLLAGWAEGFDPGPGAFVRLLLRD